MFKVVRLAKIKEIIMDRNQIDVQTLSSLLNVSSVTIRSDLEELEAEGFILRTHGGAVLNDSVNSEKTVNDLLSGAAIEYSKDKEHIAQIANHLINDDEWIFIGSGTTCYYIAKVLLGRSRLNIITNNLYAAAILSKNPGANVIVTGGSLSHSQMCLGGDMFVDSFENIFVSKAFTSVAGVDMQNGFSVSDNIEHGIFSKIRKICNELIIAVDHTKFNRISFMRVGDLNVADAVISNEKIPEEYKEYFFNNGTKIFTSYDIKKSSVNGS